MTSFATKVLAVVTRIPYGKTLTYKEVARRAGHSCHRVVRSDGAFGGYWWVQEGKKAFLAKEKSDF
jgi:O6-methylguanine-DNA--protein-cysteine methyltransferase